MILIKYVGGLFSYLCDRTRTPKGKVYILYCECCGNVLSYNYSYIITRLRKAKLLAQDCKALCCECSISKDIKRSKFSFRWD